MAFFHLVFFFLTFFSPGIDIFPDKTVGWSQIFFLLGKKDIRMLNVTTNIIHSSNASFT